MKGSEEVFLFLYLSIIALIINKMEIQIFYAPKNSFRPIELSQIVSS